jgi:hypothetical protein
MRRNGGIVMASLAKGEGELEGLSDSRKKKPNPGVGGAASLGLEKKN